MILVQIAGRLGADAEGRVTPSGQKVTTFRLATNVYQNGKEDTVWWRVTIWGSDFDGIIPYLTKGSAVFVMATMSKPEIYMDKEGRPQISLNVKAKHIQLNPFGGKNSGTEQVVPKTYGASASYAQPSHSMGEPQYSFGVSQAGMASEEASDEFEEEHVPF